MSPEGGSFNNISDSKSPCSKSGKMCDPPTDHSGLPDPDNDPCVTPVPRLTTRTSSTTTCSSGTSHSGEDVWREVGDVDDISNMVFLSPHWLMDVLKTVLTHHLIEKIHGMKENMSENDLSKYFGDNHKEHALNGIVRWSLIEDKLMDIQINSPMRDEADKDAKAALQRSIVKSLR